MQCGLSYIIYATVSQGSTGFPKCSRHKVIPKDKVETYGGWYIADKSCDPIPSRGRTRERAPQYSTHSRNSSASSARSMIDERLEWANEERFRSASRGAPEPASPFREASPYHPCQQYPQNAAWGVPPPLSLSETPANPVFGARNSFNPTNEPFREVKLDAAETEYVTCVGCSRLSADVNSSKRPYVLRKVQRHLNPHVLRKVQSHLHPDEAVHFERVKQAIAKEYHEYLARCFQKL
jgi:hypothetical protein